MARAMDWTQYDRLKTQGVSDREIARRWGIPWSTFVYYKRQRAGGPVPPVPPSPPASPAIPVVATSAMQEILAMIKDLQARVGSLEQTRVITAAPTAPAAERKDIQQWTVRLSKAMIDYVKTAAYERHMPPSQLIEELLWKALSERRASTPS